MPGNRREFLTAKLQAAEIWKSNPTACKGKCKMAAKSTALLSIYANYSGAMSAVDMLTEAGFRKSEMRIGGLTIPGLGPGPFVVSQAVRVALAGAGEDGAADGIACELITMGILKREAEHYETRVEEGGILLSVHSDKLGWTKVARDVLERTGAEDISVWID